MLLPAPGVAQAQEDGAQVYEQNCASCHGSGGAGVPGVFPPFVGNDRTTDPAYVAGVVRNGLQGPIEVGGETYDGVMPAFSQLSDAQVTAVAGYVASLSGAAPPDSSTTTATVGPVEGDTDRGEALFRGSERLSAGGPACFSCHAAGSYSQGAGGFGPDLTGAFSRLGGAAGLSAWLANPPSPTMAPIFAAHPLTEDEIASLIAFLQVVEADEPANGLDWMVVGGLGGALGLMALMTFGLRRPRGTYVERLRSGR